ncbi:MAG: hypothetical protein IJ137_12560 [Eubacterium sp.]|nr:hypothetical protein [Eubacterium sp.]
MKNKSKKESIFIKETKRDIHTFKRLDGKRRGKFIWDYFKWKILAAITIIAIVITFGRLLWLGQKPYRLHVCVVLNNDLYCDDWFDEFFEKLTADGQGGDLDLNQDQPFDYHNAYYYVQEIEVRTTVASQRMDVAVCGPDMYDYLLALNACTPLDTVLSEEEAADLKNRGMLVNSTANVRRNPDGTLNEEEAVEGCFAVDLSDTSFGHEYNDKQELDEGQEKAPLYAVIINNSKHMEDSVQLVRALCE